MDKYIKEQKWNALLAHDHETTYLKFTDIFKTMYNNSVRAIKIKQEKVENVSITDYILGLCLLKDLLWKRCKNHPNDIALKQEFRK